MFNIIHRPSLYKEKFEDKYSDKANFKEQKSDLNPQPVAKRVDELFLFARDKIIQYIISGEDYKVLLKDYGHLNLEITEGKKFVVVSVELKKAESDNMYCPPCFRFAINSIRNFVKSFSCNDYKCEAFEVLPMKLAIIFSFVHDFAENEIDGRLEYIAVKILSFVDLNLGMTSAIGVGKIYDSFGQIELSYKDSIKSLEKKIFEDEKNIILNKDITKSQSPDKKTEYPHIYQENILLALKIGDKRNILSHLFDFIKTIEDQKPDSGFIKNSFIQLIHGVKVKLIEMNVKEASYYGDMEYENRVWQVDSYKDMSRILIEYLLESAAAINDRLGGGNKDKVEKAIGFMNNNYHKNISVDDIAKEVGITPNYFANLFKNQTGDTALNYLTHLRIQRAKELLENGNVKIYDVAKRVGFSDSKYFGQVFKKHTGVLPTEFKVLSKKQIWDSH